VDIIQLADPASTTKTSEIWNYLLETTLTAFNVQGVRIIMINALGYEKVSYYGAISSNADGTTGVNYRKCEQYWQYR